MTRLLFLFLAAALVSACTQQVADIALGGDGATRPGVHKSGPRIP